MPNNLTRDRLTNARRKGRRAARPSIYFRSAFDCKPDWMAAPHHTPLKIGEWRVDPAVDEITREGKTVKLEPRAMRVLVCLAEHAGQVVSVDQLLDAVWKDVVVTPDSVYQAIAALRRALGDDTKEPSYIANVLRRGYRLVANVTPWTDSGPIDGPSPIGSVSLVEPLITTSPGVPSRRAGTAWTWIGVAGALAFVGVFVLRSFVGSHEGESWLRGMKPEFSALQGSGIAVLPFVDLSDGKDQQYFADGLSEELIERLAKIPRLRVAARSSSFYFKGRDATVPEIAQTLRVAYLLEGTVRKSGQTLRTTAHLVRAHDGYDLWSETYDRPTTDAFKVQDEIASAVIQQLNLSILASPSMGVPVLTTNADAHRVWLQALAHINNSSGGDLDAAESLLHSAVLLDPRFATGWAELAMVTMWQVDVRAPNPTAEACGRAREAAARALELDPTLPLSHRAKGMVLQNCEADFPAAEAEFNRALALQPDNPLVLMSEAHLAAGMGRFEQAMQFARHATEADPLNPWTFSAVGDVALEAGHAAEAGAAYRKALNIDSSAGFLHSALAITLLTDHKPVEAVAESEQEPDPQYRAMLLPIALDAAGRHDEAERQLAELKIRYSQERADWVGLYYACRHDADPALQWLRVYLEKHTRWMPYQPYLRDCLRNLEHDPRYQSLTRQMQVANAKNRSGH
jgi:TolB-like protein/DNA-binding winged helix-turn-helix (wHTH) protein/Tfp pilus assembly protein PilF